MENNMRPCPECNTLNENEYKYCKQCGCVLPEIKKEPVAPPPPPVQPVPPVQPQAEPPKSEPVCQYCGTLNGADFKFCKNCGAPLRVAPVRSNYYSADVPVQPVSYEEPMPAPPPQIEEPPVTEIDGVPVEDLHYFVGKNSDKIVGKWEKLYKKNGSVSWCWPVAILSYLLGAAGAAFWFLYRRMYGIGIALLAAALLFFGVETALLADPFIDMTEHFLNSPEFAAAVEEYNFTGDILTYAETIEELMANDPAIQQAQERVTLITDLFGYVNLGIGVVFSLFSMAIYKKHTFKKLRIFPCRPSPTELSMAGGTSGGALTIGIVVFAMLLLAITIGFAVYLASALMTVLV